MKDKEAVKRKQGKGKRFPFGAAVDTVTPVVFA